MLYIACKRYAREPLHILLAMLIFSCLANLPSAALAAWEVGREHRGLCSST